MPCANRVRIRLKILDAMPAAGRDQNFSGAPSRLDRRTNAFAALWIGEPGRIAGEHHARTDHRTRPDARSEIRMPMPAGTRHAGDDPLALEEVDEVPDVIVEAVIASTADPDVDEVALAHAPGVALKVTTEEQLRCRA